VPSGGPRASNVSGAIQLHVELLSCYVGCWYPPPGSQWHGLRRRHQQRQRATAAEPHAGFSGTTTPSYMPTLCKASGKPRDRLSICMRVAGPA
jgi:hypothetical protein